MDVVKRDRLQKLVNLMTSTGQVTLDDGHLSEVKGICKSGDAYVLGAYDFLLERLKEEHSQVWRQT
jgi:hypothetical protein